MPVSKIVNDAEMTGIVCGTNKNERVILWEDDSYERLSHAEFARTYDY